MSSPVSLSDSIVSVVGSCDTTGALEFVAVGRGIRVIITGAGGRGTVAVGTVNTPGASGSENDGTGGRKTSWEA